ncbi:GPI-GlcNAc transferase complex, PIG-H component-domain-containing protein [Chaetomium strumarium]|uniref:GPI-GlcNAc transferase complex, PIG-H component-domain-containing protein n=1 Tax=Chaetomium strumarium TaxID=1170767 RepID=A0AAJ0GQK8_9PEZI|nr:GPI-GlcNAc transferase complex, PIG-H component-domain-containing protein [Chaetomium strumarium]
MLTTAPHLYIRRPSPTTAEFTVTTCPPLTVPLRLLLLTLHLARALLFSAAILVLYARFVEPSQHHDHRHHYYHHQGCCTPIFPFQLFLAGDVPQFLTTLLQTAHRSQPGIFLSQLTAPLPDWAVAAASLAAAYAAVCFRLHRTESVLVLRGLGIQTCTIRGKWGGCFGTQTRFIPTEQIRDVLINEAFRGFEVRYYLIVVVEGEEDVVVLFPGLLPRRRIVEAVWRGVKGCLFEGEEDGKG